MSSGRFIHRGYRAQGFASRTWALAGGGAAASPAYETSRHTLNGTSTARHTLNGTSTARHTLNGTAATRHTLSGATP